MDDGWEALQAAARRVEAERLNGVWWTRKPEPRPEPRTVGTIDWGDTEIDVARRRKELLAEDDQQRRTG
jgi:hypothetical protein